MTDAWFSMGVAENLKWLSFLSLFSLLVVFPLQGRYRPGVTSVWVAGLVVGGFCLSAFAVALAVQQPAYVLRPLFIMGIALTLAFAMTFGPMRRAYREAELRKTVARDI